MYIYESINITRKKADAEPEHKNMDYLKNQLTKKKQMRNPSTRTWIAKKQVN